MMNRFAYIRSMYQDALPSLLKHYPMMDVNFIDWYSLMTPIEKKLWIEIRSYGLPMLPQFPTQGFFIDFADPVKQIALEADGREFHRDKEKDMKRDAILEKAGWTIYHIPGFFMNGREEIELDTGDDPHFLEHLLLEIKERHYELVSA